DITVYLDNLGTASITAADVDGGSTDNCAIDSLVVDVSTFSCTDIGPMTVQLTVFDSAGNVDSAMATVTVEDTLVPTITCPSDTTLSNAMGACGATFSYTINTGDNCAGTVVNQTAGLPSGSTFPVGVTTNRFTVTDAGGNVDSCSFTVTVIDTTNPAITCPSDTAVSNDAGLCSAVVNYTTPIGTDNCMVDTVKQIAGLASGAAFPVGVTMNTFVVLDEAGNSDTCSFTVTVSDTSLPVIFCPSPVVVSNDNGFCSAVVIYATPGATDNCQVDTIQQIAGLASGAAFPVGVTTNTFVVSDTSGNTDTCSFTITVQDSTAPTIACPNDTAVVADAGLCTALVNYTTPAGMDNCAVDTVMQINGLASGSAFPVGVTTNTFVVTDTSGNSDTCSFTITVTDTIPPVITCPANILVSNDSGDCSAVVMYPTPGATDNCGIDTVQQIAGLASGAMFPVGVTTNMWVATDTSGNSDTCRFNVVVTDDEAPMAIPRNVIVYLDGSGTASLTAAMVDSASSDNCAIDTLILDSTTFSCAHTGSAVTVNLIVNDTNGNADTAQAMVTVLDTISPMAVTQNVTVYLDGSGNASISATDIDNSSSDNCAIQSVVIDSTTFDCSHAGDTVIGTMTVTDVNGNASMASYEVYVEDSVAPVVAVQNLTVYLDSMGNASITASDVDNGTTDNCLGAVVLSIDSSMFDCPHAGDTITGTFTATDPDNNVSSAAYEVYVKDTIDPSVLAQDITVYLDGNGSVSINTSDVDLGTTDNCSIDTLILSQSTFACADSGANNITFEAIDASGNSTLVSLVVTVVDSTAPVLDLDGPTVSLDSMGQAMIAAADLLNGNSEVFVNSADLVNWNGAGACSGTRRESSSNLEGWTWTDALSASAQVDSIIMELTMQFSASSTFYTFGLNGDSLGTAPGGGSGGCSVEVQRFKLDLSSYNFGGFNTFTWDFPATDHAIISNPAWSNAFARVSIFAKGISDNCTDSANIVVTISDSLFDCNTLGAQTIVVTATDHSGNTRTDSTVVTIVDDISPAISAVDDTVYLGAAGNASVDTTDLSLTITENCTLDSVSLCATDFICADTGFHAIQIYAEDASGNTDSVTVQLLVRDTTPPTA
ncbi:MAG: HYR domain-containing protein, partial [Bacteroidota bacterium]